MNTNIASLVTASGILLFLDGKQFTIGTDHPNFAKIKTALANKKFNEIPLLADVVSSVRTWLNNGRDLELRGDQVYLNGVPFSAEVTTKVLSMIKAGASVEPLANFLRKVRQNPSNTAQNELLLFCVANGFMIHEDGDLVAYKSVRGNYTDIHSGKFLNSVGKVVTMERGQVDDNRDRTCSTGLHFASYDYASTWAGNIDGVNRRLMVMKINPRDVVSIPSDYNNQKGRCARYEVIAELTTNTPLPKQEVYTAASLGVPASRAVRNADAVAHEQARKSAAEREAHRAARIKKIDDSIVRKRSVIREYEQKWQTVQNNIDKITKLGGWATTDTLTSRTKLEKFIRQVESEVAELQKRRRSI